MGEAGRAGASVGSPGGLGWGGGARVALAAGAGASQAAPSGVRRLVGVLPGKHTGRFPGGGRERARDRRGGAELKNATGPACVLSPWLVPGKEERPRVREGAGGGW